MIRHLLKLVWNRRRANLLIMVEILISFWVLFGVVLTVAQYWLNYRRPLGFDYDNVWCVSFSTGEHMQFFRPDSVKSQRELVRRLAESLKDFPQIEASAVAVFPPFSSSRAVYLENLEAYPVTDSFREVMNIRLLEGEWFNEGHDLVDWVPVIINLRYAGERFGEASPLGQILNEPGEEGQEMRVIGVINDFRKEGEFAPPGNIGFWRISLTHEKGRAASPRILLIRVQPGTGVVFEEQLMRHLSGVAPEWTFDIRPLDQIREEHVMWGYLGPLLMFGVVVGFLLLMVGFGLTGVLWQAITQRTREIGLRRAQGATARHIHVQVLGELLLMATLSMVLGAVVVFQLPLLDLLSFFDAGLYTVSILVTMLMIYTVTMISTLYPSHLASRVQPVEALHYE